GYFAQDDWKVNPRLTLNLGVRYDLYTHPYEAHNNQSNFDLTSQTLLVGGQNGNSRSLIDNNYTNFAPRVGFAYDVTGKGQTVLRGGYGIFYFLDRGGVGNQLSNNPDFNGSAEYRATDGYRITFTGQGPSNDNNNVDATQPLPLPVFGSTVNRSDPRNVSLVSVDKHLPTSTIQEWNLQWQQQLDANTSVNIAYVGTKSDHLMTWFNLNNQVLDTPENTLLYPLRGTITRGIAAGTSKYNGLQVFVNRRLAQGFQFTAAYTWSHTLDDSNGAFNSGTAAAGTRVFITPAGPDLRANYGNADQDQRNVFVFSALAELPFGKGKIFASNIPTALNYLIGGWQTNTIVTLASGTPFDVNTNQGLAPDTGADVGASPNNRADVIKPITYRKSVHEWFNTSAFTVPPVVSSTDTVFTRPGTLGRNQLSGPAFRSMDLSLFKNVPLYSERVIGQFRAEAFNLTNTPAFANPDGYMQDSNFGVISTTRNRSERQLELAFRVTF
ncbi:MAG TPA: TonB-dependent receptor, partial [Pseudacidobacterium sp.]|nr:TonB-dependent receptor [Pseudacidobacterium sp.]